MTWQERFLAALKNRVQLRGWISFLEGEIPNAMADILAKDKTLAVKAETPGGRMEKAGDGNDWKSASYSFSREGAVASEMARIFGESGEWPVDTLNRLIRIVSPVIQEATMIQLIITKTSKPFGSKKNKYSIFDCTTESFANVESAKAWLQEEYGKSRKQPIYKDGPNEKPIKIGYVIGFKNADYSHTPVSQWLQRDWIEFREVKTVELP